jgi:Uma2 family endonuclease
MGAVRPAIIPRTYEDYAAVPSDGRRWELIDGEFEVNPAPTSLHQTVSRRLQFELMEALEEPGLAQVFDAPIDVILGELDVLQPDLAIIAANHTHIISARGIEGPPDVVIEILSPSTSTLDRRVKRRTYARYGVPEYWIVDPKLAHIEQYGIGEAEYVLNQRFDRASTLTTPSFPEVAIDMSWVFRG